MPKRKGASGEITIKLVKTATFGASDSYKGEINCD